MNSLLSSYIYVMVYLLMQQNEAFISREPIINEPLTLPCTCSVKCPEVLWSRFIPDQMVVAHRRTCPYKKQYERRFSVTGDGTRGDFSLTISSVAYNDAGSYRCSCNGTMASEFKLNVLVPTVLKALEGENVLLPCYLDTRQHAKDVTWRKAGVNVLLYAHANQPRKTGSRYRMSVEGFRDGDLSLHISPVQKSDAGLYRCFLHDESQDGEPRAVLLKVEGQKPAPNSGNKISVVCVCAARIDHLCLPAVLIVYIMTRWSNHA